MDHGPWTTHHSPTMRRLQVTRLTRLLLELILDQLDFVDLIQFSFLSKRCLEIVKTYKPKVARIHLILNSKWTNDIIIDNNLQITIESFPQPRISNLITNYNYQLIRIKGLSELLINSNGSTELRLACVHDNRKEVFQWILAHLKAIFHVEQWSVKGHNVPGDGLLESLQKVGRFEDALIISDSVNLQGILETVNIKNLTLDARIPVLCQIQNPSKIQNLKLNSSEWLTLHDLLTMNISQLTISMPQTRLRFPYLDNKALNQLIKTWLQGGLQNLEFIKLHGVFWDDVEFNDLRGEEPGVQFMEGVNWVKWNQKNRPEKYGDQNLKNGRDIQRSDGVWATVKRSHGSFGIYVWKGEVLGI